MKRVILMGVVAAVLGFAMAASAGDVETVSGELVSLNCYLKSKAAATGDAHRDCALSDARRGQALAILAGDDLYIIKGEWTSDKNARLLEFVAQSVQATGDVTDVNGKKMLKLANITAAK